MPIDLLHFKEKEEKRFFNSQRASFYFDYENANCFQVYMNGICLGEFSYSIHNYTASIYLSCQGQSITAVHTQYF